ncbi:MAG TPA: FtsW/RodA/SpoVE family cell cycle protein [Acidimicrobiales bacterium]|nr:FtsW/RodA/SpoVE family cell cycle protein [Acidimicrobiales bacterium]
MPRLLPRREASDTTRFRPKPRRRTELGLLLFGSLIIVAMYVLASIGTTSKIPPDLGPFLAIVLGLALTAHVANRIYAPDANAVLLPIVTLLNGLGYVMLARINEHFARLQAGWTAVGVGAYILTLALVRRSRDLDRYRYLLLLGAVALMLAPLVPHLGKNINGARLWVSIGPANGQPVELAKLALCIFFASYFVEKRELLSVPTMRVGNRLVLDPRPMVPILMAWGFSMVVLGAENDIGFAVLIFVLFIAMLWLTTGRWTYVGIGVVLFLVGSFVASHLFHQVHHRIQEWLHPATNGQVMSGLFGLGTGGLLGTGLGFGQVQGIPEAHSDYIFAAFGTEMGLLGTTVIVFAFLLIVGAGMRIAQTARSEFAQMCAAGFTVILGVQALFIMAGIVRLMPLTGITLPFMAYGGSSLVANYVLIALLMRISDEGERQVVTQQATAHRLTQADYGAVPVAGT